ncbi:MAG: hypothetical protein HQM16_05725 [Deltaproteobacteria bacterium]|nr:hypothetical protein [Deltaproteobacteria bacterium]
MKLLKLLITMVIIAFVFVQCGQSGGKAEPSDPAQDNPSQDNPAPDPDPGISSTVGGTITGVVEVEGDINLSSVSSYPSLRNQYLSQVSGIEVYLEDSADIYAVTDSEGVFTMSNVPAGSNCIYAFAEDQSGETYAFRSCNIEVVDGSTTDVGAATLTITGSISGNVRLNEQTNHSGIDVYIPGTSFMAKTDENGSFIIYDLPAGTYETLAAETDGYLSDSIDNVIVSSGANTVVNNMILWASTGVDGFLTINNGATVSNSRTVTLNLYYSQDATLMKISEDENFKNVSWEAATPSKTYVFDSEGTKTMHVKFADGNGLETSPLTATVTIDLFGASEGSFTLAPDTLVPSTSTMGDVALSLNIPDNASYFMADVDSNFSNASGWMDLPAEGVYTYSLPNNYNSCGLKTIYVKYKDSDGYVSETYSAALKVDCWVAMSSTNAPQARYGHGYVWTGDSMCVWGGYGSNSSLNTGACYVPSSDSWSTISTTNAPEARTYPAIVWTGDKMCVWGGYSNNNFRYVNTGGCYDPDHDSWSAITTTNAPEARSHPTAIWTGDKMCVWGGRRGGDYYDTVLNTGACYTPGTDSWSPITTTNAPEARSYHTAIWTGDKMCVWGGAAQHDASTINTGGCYDPDHDSWSTTTTTNAPQDRRLRSGVWTGDKMCVWGGSSGFLDHLNTGGCYDPEDNLWSTITTSNAPVATASPTAVWTEKRMCVWGGGNLWGNKGGCYDISTNTWSHTPVDSAPEERSGQAASWTGSEMCVWGGYGSSGAKGDGACLKFIQ